MNGYTRQVVQSCANCKSFFLLPNLSFYVGNFDCLGNNKPVLALDERSRQNARHSLAYRPRLLHAFQITHSTRARRLAYRACIRKHQLEHCLLAVRSRLFLLDGFTFARSFSWSHNIRTCPSMIRSLLSYDGPSKTCLAEAPRNSFSFHLRIRMINLTVSRCIGGCPLGYTNARNGQRVCQNLL